MRPSNLTYYFSINEDKTAVFMARRKLTRCGKNDIWFSSTYVVSTSAKLLESETSFILAMNKQGIIRGKKTDKWLSSNYVTNLSQVYIEVPYKVPLASLTKLGNDNPEIVGKIWSLERVTNVNCVCEFQDWTSLKIK